MITAEDFEEIALSFPETEKRPHFDRVGYRIQRKRMFATYLAKDHTANVFLSPSEQCLFVEIDSVSIYPVPNKWGEKGATTFDLNCVSEEVLREALWSAYKEVLKK